MSGDVADVGDVKVALAALGLPAALAGSPIFSACRMLKMPFHTENMFAGAPDERIFAVLTPGQLHRRAAASAVVDYMSAASWDEAFFLCYWKVRKGGLWGRGKVTIRALPLTCVSAVQRGSASPAFSKVKRSAMPPPDAQCFTVRIGSTRTLDCLCSSVAECALWVHDLALILRPSGSKKQASSESDPASSAVMSRRANAGAVALPAVPPPPPPSVPVSTSFSEPSGAWDTAVRNEYLTRAAFTASASDSATDVVLSLDDGKDNVGLGIGCVLGSPRSKFCPSFIAVLPPSCGLQAAHWSSATRRPASRCCSMHV